MRIPADFNPVPGRPKTPVFTLYDSPEELERREERRQRILEAKARIEARAQARFGQEQAEYEAKCAARAQKARATGKKHGEPPPTPPTAGPGPKDQVNLTDPESRIMPLAGGGFEQCYNAQAVVAAETLLVVAGDIIQACNDKEQIAPMLGQLGALPEDVGRPEILLADSGYFSEANVGHCEQAGVILLIALGRERHYRAWRERFASDPPAPEAPTPVQAMAHRLRTTEGRRLYALRKHTPEPVFGIWQSCT